MWHLQSQQTKTSLLFTCNNVRSSKVKSVGAHRTDEGESSTELLWVTGVLIYLQQCCELTHLEQHFCLPYLLHLETANMTAPLRMGQLLSLHTLFDVMLCQEAIGKTRSYCRTKPATTFNHKVKVSTGKLVA